MDRITAGYLPLLDCAVLAVAHEIGMAADEDIELVLVRETSWANIRDRMAVGHFDVAQMLAPMPIASNLGLTPMPLSQIAPFALGLGGNAVTVSNDVWREMQDAGARPDGDARRNGAALRAMVGARGRAGRKPLGFAVVHPYSGHNLELRYWLAASGIDPSADVEIVVVPPPLMSDALAAGRIDGFCVGEPWSSVAVEKGAGRIATVKAAIWKASPEKVLGVGERWATSNAEILARLLRALYRAAAWCGDPGNRDDLAALLAGAPYLSVPPAIVHRALSGSLDLGGGNVCTFDDFFVPFDKAATFPWQSHALWFYSQMVRWGQVAHSAAATETARRSYRPDVYRAALAPLGAPLPGANAKVEGALAAPQPVGAIDGALTLGPDGFFDDVVFDPDRLDAYIAAQAPVLT